MLVYGIVLSSKSPLQIILLLWFVVFVVVPFKVPADLSSWIDSPLGMVILFLCGTFLFVHAHPIVTIAFVVYAYVLLSRSNQEIKKKTQKLDFTPTVTRNSLSSEQRKALTTVKERTLEEDVVETMAPLGKGIKGAYVETSFKPVADDVHGAFTHTV